MSGNLILNLRGNTGQRGGGVIVGILLLAGCSSPPSAEPPPTELKLSDSSTVEAPETVTFHEAKRLYRAGLFTVAEDSFKSLRVNYPLSPYLEYSEIKLADSKFEGREYSEAAALYEQFIKDHPASRAVPYMTLRAARSYQLVNRGVGRDVTPLEKASTLYDQLITNHPSTVYAAEARMYREEVAQLIADYDRMVMAFYEKRQKQKAREARELAFRDRWNGRMVLASLDEPVQSVAPVIAEHHHVVAAELNAPKLMLARAEGEAPKIDQAVARAQLRINDSGTAAPLTDRAPDGTNFRVQRVICSDDQLFIFFDNPIEDPTFLSKYGSLTPERSKLRVQLPHGVSKASTNDCFGKGDLEISTSGEITVTTSRSAQLLTLNNPPRLLVALK